MELLSKWSRALWAGMLLLGILCKQPAGAQTYKYPVDPITYPRESDFYAVIYNLNNTGWAPATTFISYYGGSNSSPWRSDSKYLDGPTSMTFMNLPVEKNSHLEVRVFKIWDGSFKPEYQPEIRPAAKGIASKVDADGSVHFSYDAGPDFKGEQFVLWWNQNSSDTAGVEGLAFFLTPRYNPPKSTHLLEVSNYKDLEGDLSAYDTIIIKGDVSIGGTGDHALLVPANITKIYFEPGSWLQGKLVFAQNDGTVRKVYGNGVLDASRFNYADRHAAGEQGYPAITEVGSDGQFAKIEYFHVEGITIVDSNFYSSAPMANSKINNVKVLTWNGNNDGLGVDSNSVASNIFIRSGDDSIKVWGSNYSVSNATVWQNYNGGCVNLGWSKNSPGEGGKIDGLYVVRTDWVTPASPSWTADDTDSLAHQNNAVIASCMVPGTQFGKVDPPVFRNIYLDEAPWTLFSLKIIPPALQGAGDSAGVDLTASSVLNIKIENLMSPPSMIENSIGFQNIPAGFSFNSITFPTAFTLGGTMDVHLKNVYFTDGRGGILSRPSIITNGSGVMVHYDD